MTPAPARSIKPVAEAEFAPELGEPAAAPDPVRKKRINKRADQKRGDRHGEKPRPLQRAAQRNRHHQREQDRLPEKKRRRIIAGLGVAVEEKSGAAHETPMMAAGHDA